MRKVRLRRPSGVKRVVVCALGAQLLLGGYVSVPWLRFVMAGIGGSLRWVNALRDKDFHVFSEYH
jgi:hypothetical protein